MARAWSNRFHTKMRPQVSCPHTPSCHDRSCGGSRQENGGHSKFAKEFSRLSKKARPLVSCHKGFLPGVINKEMMRVVMEYLAVG